MRVSAILCGLLLAWTTASAQSPPAGEAYYQFLRARYLESQGEIDEAVKALRQAASLDPASAEILAELSALYARQDRGREALEAAESALRLDPRNAEAHRVAGYVYASLARVESDAPRGGSDAAALAAKAAAHLEAARRPNRVIDASLELTLARAYLGAGAPDKAIPGLRRLVEVEPEQGEAVALLAQALEQAGRPGEALALLEDAARAEPAFLAPLAEAYEQQGRWEEAAGAYEKAVLRNPRSTDLRVRLAVALLSGSGARRGDKALEVLEPLRQASPENVRVLYLVAEAQRASGQLEAAERTARDLIAAAPSLPSGPEVLARVLAGRHRYAEAVAVLDEAAARFPKDLEIRFQVGALYEEQGRFAEAERAFREVIAKDPRHAAALNYLGYMLADRGERLDEAIGLIERALEIDPANPSYIDSLGWAYFKTGRLEMAETYLGKAARQRVQSSAVQDHFGDLLFRLGRYEEAVAAWERALAGDGSDVDAEAIRKKLQSARAKGKESR